MKVIREVAEMVRWRAEQRGRVGFVPTMGALHEGHGSLIAASVAELDTTAVSIYVNPTQFNNPDDLAAYPDTLAADIDYAQSLGAAVVFLPTYSDIYPDDFTYLVDETALSRSLCGEHRPGHFTGVLTVVMKLLNIVQPTRAYFGEKDYQQYLLIKGMAAAFFLTTDIVAGTTVREEDGLAMSSRNLNLSACDRRLAPRFPSWLRREASDDAVIQGLTDEGFVVDYVISRDGRRFGAVTLGPDDKPVRLIDNVEIAR